MPAPLLVMLWLVSKRNIPLKIVMELIHHSDLVEENYLPKIFLEQHSTFPLEKKKDFILIIIVHLFSDIHYFLDIRFQIKHKEQC